MYKLTQDLKYYLNIVVVTSPMILHIKWWVKLKSYNISRVYIDVPYTLCIMWVTAWIVRSRKGSCWTVE